MSAQYRRKFLKLSLVASLLLIVPLWHGVTGPGRGAGLVFAFAWCVYILGYIPMMVLHELGHALVGRLVGIRPLALTFGTGVWLVDRHVAGIRVRVGRDLAGGATYFDFSDDRALAARMIALTAGGAAANAVMAVATFCVARAHVDGSISRAAGIALLVLSAVNVLLVVGNLWPRVIRRPEGLTPNDGALILKCLRGEVSSAGTRRANTHALRATFAYADEDFAVAAREAGLAADAADAVDVPEKKRLLLAYQAEALCELGDPAAADELLPLLAQENLDDGSRVAMNAALAWACLLRDQPERFEEGLERITRCFELMPWNIALVIKRVCLLAVSASADNGRIAEARLMMETFAFFDFDRESRAYAALARGLVAAAAGDARTARAEYERARVLRATAAPLRVLERRLASN